MKILLLHLLYHFASTSFTEDAWSISWLCSSKLTPRACLLSRRWQLIRINSSETSKDHQRFPLTILQSKNSVWGEVIGENHIQKLQDPGECYIIYNAFTLNYRWWTQVWGSSCHGMDFGGLCNIICKDLKTGCDVVHPPYHYFFVCSKSFSSWVWLAALERKVLGEVGFLRDVYKHIMYIYT